MPYPGGSGELAAGPGPLGICGWRCIRVTSNRHGHLFPKARQAVADSLDETFRRAAAQPPATKMRPKPAVALFPNAGQGPEKGP
ncbi:MAG: hypothetical protein QOJ23_2227 [Actinomycetota bacterium]|nr:hypothetical protein [Actinomycetota bacterium]